MDKGKDNTIDCAQNNLLIMYAVKKNSVNDE